MNAGYLILRWAVLTISVWVAAFLVHGIDYSDNWQSLVIAALVLGVLNAIIKPVLLLLSLPFILVTLGLFLVVINAVLLLLTSALVPGFDVNGFWAAVFGSLIISLINLLLGGVSQNRRRSVASGPKQSGGPGSSQDVIDV